MEINAHVIVPLQVVELLKNLMLPLPCCPTKRGLELPAVYVYENKAYCEPCLQKLADDMEAAEQAKKLLD